MARRTTKPKSRIVTVDFTGVDATRFRPPEGEYHVRIDAVDKGESSNGNDQLEVDMEVLDGKYEGKTFRVWFSLVPEALWKLAGFLTSVGVEVPESELDLDMDELVDKKLGIVIEHRDYEGKTKYDIADHFPLEEDEPEEPPKKGAKKEKDEPPAKGSKKKSPPKLSAQEVKDMDEDELGEVVDKYELDVELDDYKTLRKKAAAVLDALETADMIEE